MRMVVLSDPKSDKYFGRYEQFSFLDKCCGFGGSWLYDVLSSVGLVGFRLVQPLECSHMFSVWLSGWLD